MSNEWGDGGGPVNINYDWILRRPSTLLWVDKIVVTPRFRDVVDKGVEAGDPYLSNAMREAYGVLETQGLLVFKDPSPLATDSNRRQIWESISEDVEFAEASHPGALVDVREAEPAKISPGSGIPVCRNLLFSVYSALFFADKWNASCLFSPVEFRLLQVVGRGARKRTLLRDVMSALLPEVGLFPDIAIGLGDKCTTCGSLAKCKTSYLADVRRNVLEYLSWRNYDEMFQLRKVVRRIIEKRDELEPDNMDEVLAELLHEKNRIERRMNKVFPKVQGWCNLVTAVSLPFALAGLAGYGDGLKVAGAAIAGVSQVVGKVVGENLARSNKWVAFYNKLKVGRGD